MIVQLNNLNKVDATICIIIYTLGSMALIVNRWRHMSSKNLILIAVFEILMIAKLLTSQGSGFAISKMMILYISQLIINYLYVFTAYEIKAVQIITKHEMKIEKEIK